MDLLLIVLIVLAIFAVGAGFAIKWLFILAVVLILLALIRGFGHRV